MIYLYFLDRIGENLQTQHLENIEPNFQLPAASSLGFLVFSCMLEPAQGDTIKNQERLQVKIGRNVAVLRSSGYHSIGQKQIISY